MRTRRVVPDIRGENPADSREFYETVLGFELVMDQGWVVTFAAPDNPAAQITVMRGDASAPLNPDVSIEVNDADQAFAAAQQLGCDILYPLTDEPWGVRRFFVREPKRQSVEHPQPPLSRVKPSRATSANTNIRPRRRGSERTVGLLLPVARRPEQKLVLQLLARNKMSHLDAPVPASSFFCFAFPTGRSASQGGAGGADEPRLVDQTDP